MHRTPRPWPGRRTAVVSALVVALGLAACGNDSEAGLDNIEAPAPSVVNGESTPAATDTDDPSSEDDDLVLPVTARYGDVEFTVESATVVATPPEDVSVTDEADAYAIVEITAAGVVEELSWSSVPFEGLLTLVAGDEEAAPINDSSPYAFELVGLEPMTAAVIFPVESGTDISKASIVIQEAASDPDERRRATELPLGGGAPTDLPDAVALTAQGGPVTIAPIGDTAFATVVSAELTSTIGATETGGAWPGGGWEGLRQAREGELFLRLIVDFTSENDSSVGCTGSISLGTYAEDGVPVGEAIDNENTEGSNSTGACEGSPANRMMTTYAVPDDRDSYEIQYTNYDASVAGSVILQR